MACGMDSFHGDGHVVVLLCASSDKATVNKQLPFFHAIIVPNLQRPCAAEKLGYTNSARMPVIRGSREAFLNLRKRRMYEVPVGEQLEEG